MSLVKKEARLSGMLLARKGSALPAHTDHRLTVQAVEPVESKQELEQANKERAKHEDIVPAESDSGMLVEAVKEINNVTKRQYNKVVGDTVEAPVSKVEAKKSRLNVDVEPETEAVVNVNNVEVRKASPVIKDDVKPTKNVKLDTKRIAMTLRMEHADHLKLRLYAAHSRKSCQEIISEALDMYLSEDEKVCGLSDCNCLANKKN